MKRLMLLLGLVGVMLLSAAAPALADSAATAAATSVGTTTATLNGSVDINGALVESCEFKYGPTTAYSDTPVDCTTNPAASGSSTVSASATGLTAGSNYHDELVVTYLSAVSLANPIPSTLTVNGGDSSFSTQSSSGATGPAATTVAATDVFSTTAQLNGSVIPGSAALTDCHFTYGTSATAMTSTAPCDQGNVGAGTTAVPVSAVIGKLSASTTYYFALVTSSGSSTSTGSTLNFASGTTAAPMPGATTNAVTPSSDTAATLSGSVNPEGAGVINCLFQYGETASYSSSVACSPAPTDGTTAETETAALSGLSTGATYHYRIVFETGGGFATGSDMTFTTGGGQATSAAATAVTGSTATLNGSVNPEGETVTACEFYYGTTVAYGQSAPCAQTNITGSSATSVSAAIKGLAPTTTYHFLVSITTSQGTAYGTDTTFTTLKLPTGSTLKATGVTQNSATLHGTVNPQGATVIACEFEYGISPFGYGGVAPYGRTVPCAKAPATNSSNQSVSVTLKGLAAKTTYYDRVILLTQGGYFIGSTLSFRTSAKKTNKKPTPGVVITKFNVNPKVLAVAFYFKATGQKANRFQCALAKLNKKGKAGRLHYVSCNKKIGVFLHLKANTKYEVFVRAHGKYGWGRPATRKFKA